MLFRFKLFSLLLLIGLYSYSQHDGDAIRYSRYGLNGSSRFVGLGGAFGAVGADLSCAAFNPAGLGLYRKGEITFSAALKTTNNEGIINSKSSSVTNAAIAFNNFGILGGWVSKNDKESRNVIAFTNTQTQNFASKIRMSSYTNSTSIMSDMLSAANQKNASNSDLNSFYEGMAYQTYLLNYDNASNKYVSLLDTKRTVKQTRDIATEGRVNELNFSYAYSFKDKFYFGASVGVPRVQYTSTTTHVESDDKDSMRIGFTSPNTYTSTYSDGVPGLDSSYSGLLGFRSLTYTEYFKTTGTGINLKIGGIMRVNDVLRLGLYYHTPSIYYMKDIYFNSMSASYDKINSITQTIQDPPDGGGYFNYKVITPSRLSLNAAFVIKQISVIGIDYEIVNYKNASLSSKNISDFAGVNAVIKDKYKMGHNLRIGTEFNIKPIMFRFGYNMQGSPFGNSFTGTFVRNSFSIGAGFRAKNNFYFDLVWVKTLTTEDYHLFDIVQSTASLKYNATSVSATIGVKF